MNLETINKWLDEKYGCSYTRLEELHYAIILYNLITNLQNNNQKLKKQIEVIDKAIDYMQNHQLVFRDHTIEEIDEWFNRFYMDVLDILKGVKNDE